MIDLGEGSICGLINMGGFTVICSYLTKTTRGRGILPKVNDKAETYD